MFLKSNRLRGICMDDKNLEIVSGDGSDLDFSEVTEHISELTAKPKEPKHDVIIPEVTTGDKKKKKREDDEDEDENEDNEKEIIFNPFDFDDEDDEIEDIEE